MKDEPDTTGKLRSLDINRIFDLLDDQPFPVDTDELCSTYDDVTVSYPGGGGDSLARVLRTSGRQTYETMDDLQLSILNGVQRNAVGRPRYSDRDPPVAGDEHDHQQSF
ncbi:PepSY-associated TM helix domain-containing protein [Haloprofundus salinisoli]|uniref:PepSY-associated TM helix domain-containing protein n=1 Tax=Haloprofundus salinisoli TaxID=2876193 RepID=UPI001CCFDE09|nr:PepSY-associated TM helix domain-containing protein [Haloprofundus salinisoli]